MWIGKRWINKEIEICRKKGELRNLIRDKEMKNQNQFDIFNMELVVECLLLSRWFDQKGNFFFVLDSICKNKFSQNVDYQSRTAFHQRCNLSSWHWLIKKSRWMLSFSKKWKEWRKMVRNGEKWSVYVNFDNHKTRSPQRSQLGPLFFDFFNNDINQTTIFLLITT